MEAKRARSLNLSQEERETLLSLVRERISIIEDKGCDGRMQKHKQKMWMEVKALFEAEHGGDRSLQRMKEQWRRMKLSSKDSITMLKKYQRGTGGGGSVPPTCEVPTEVDYQVYDLIPDQFRKDSSTFDDDAELEILQEKETEHPSLSLTMLQQSESKDGEDVDEENVQNIIQKRQKRGKRRMSPYEEAMLALTKEKHRRRKEMDDDLYREDMEIKKFQKMYWEAKYKNEIKK